MGRMEPQRQYGCILFEMISYENTFEILLSKFTCCYKTLINMNLEPSYGVWNLHQTKGVPNYKLLSLDPYTSTNPFSLMLCGTKISVSLFGARQDYNPYMKSHYPYMQLEKTFLLPVGTLYSAFTNGFNPKGRDTYDVLPKGDVAHMAFHTGRFLLNKFFNLNVAHHKYPFFK